MQCPPIKKECVHIDISVKPTKPPPPPPEHPGIPPKLVAIMKKYKPNWRLNMLSRPKWLTVKFRPLPPGFVRPKKIPPRLSDEIKFYAEEISKPKLINLYENRRLYGKLSKSMNKKFTKHINKTWQTIYNYYKMKERDRKLRQMRQLAKAQKGKKRKINEKIIQNLAQPKKVFKPEPRKKPSKIFSDFDRLDDLATPKHNFEIPEKYMGISPAALTYEPTEAIFRLAKNPDRPFLQPAVPGKVKKSALKYVATERILALAVAKKRDEKSVDLDFDPWVISRNALKCKPSARILELARPRERD